MDIKKECINISKGKDYKELMLFLQSEILKSLFNFNNYSYSWNGKFNADQKGFLISYNFPIPYKETIKDLNDYHKEVRAKMKNFCQNNKLKLKKINKNNIKETASDIVIDLEFLFL